MPPRKKAKPLSVEALTSKADIDALVEARRSQIAELQGEVLALLTHRNTLGVIARVPIEIWAEIFLQVIAIPNPTWGLIRMNGPHSWLFVTLVCRKWRQAALTCPRLWTRIILTSCTDRVEAFIKRSGNLPLDIEQSRRGETTETLHLTQDIFHEFHRIRSLEGFAMGNFFVPPRNPEMIRCAKEEGYVHLRSLSMTVTPMWADGIPYISDVKMPALQKLSFSGGTFAVARSLAHPTLTNLTLTNLDELVPAADVAAMLKNLPLLSYLSLGDIVADTVEVVTPTWRVELPNLRSLHMSESGNGMGSISLYNHIKYPLGTSVTILTDITPSLPEFAAMMSVVGARIAGQDMLPASQGDETRLRSASFLHEDGTFTFSTGVSYLDDDDDDELLDDNVFEFSCPMPADCEAFVRAIVGAFPSLNTIEEVAVEDVGLDYQTWTALSRLQALSFVECRGRGSMLGLVDALEKSLKKSPPDATLLPNVAMLSFQEVNWERPKPRVKSPAKRLATALEQRKTKLALQCESLKIDNPEELSKPDIKALEKVVDFVEVVDASESDCGCGYHRKVLFW